MKFLEMPELVKLTAALEAVDLGDHAITCILEAYSCKQTTVDKKLSKEIERKVVEEYTHSPAKTVASPLGPLSHSNTRKLLANLISTLNSSLPDYDFSDISPKQFRQEHNAFQVVNSFNTLVLDALDKVIPSVKERLWKAVDDIVNLKQCEIYSFDPDSDSGFTEDKLWAVMYFFVSNQEKKILFLYCAATRQIGESKSEMDLTQPTFDMEEDGETQQHLDSDMPEPPTLQSP